MAKHELGVLLGKTISEIDQIPYVELLSWFAFLEQRPIGWREDNRASVIAMSMGGSDKIKPEDLFQSLKQLKKGAEEKDTSTTVAKKFMDRFGDKLTQKGFGNATHKDNPQSS